MYFKKTIVTTLTSFLLLGGAYGADEIGKANIPEEHKIKVSKEKIVKEKRIKFATFEDGYVGDYIKYRYKTDKVVEDEKINFKGKLLDEAKDKRTEQTRFYKDGETHIAVMGGEKSFYKDGEDWKEIDEHQIPVKEYEKQTKSLIGRIIKKVKADEDTFYTDDDAAMYSTVKATWAAAHDAATADGEITDLLIQTRYYTGNSLFYIYRGFMTWPISVIVKSRGICVVLISASVPVATSTVLILYVKLFV